MDNNDTTLPETSVESFWGRALQSLEHFSGQIWSDKAEHDPGITLLEGVTDRVTELARRQALPLKDLLIPQPIDNVAKLAVFPDSFGPQLGLTCGPVTMDDFRKVLLDLHCNDDDLNLQNGGDKFKQAFFLFADVYIAKESQSDRYKYYYDTDSHEFTFEEEVGSADGSNDRELLGNYSLYLVPGEELQQNYTLLNTAKRLLPAYLSKIENIGEKFTDINWLGVSEKDLILEIEVEGNISATDLDSCAKIYAEVYRTIKDFACSPIERYSTQDLNMQGLANEDIFNGPFLRHGWLPELIPARNYTQAVTFKYSQLLAKLQAISGVSKIITGPTDLTVEVDPNMYLSFGHTVDSILANVSLKTKSQDELSKDFGNIAAWIPPKKLIDNSDIVSFVGQYNNVAEYGSVTEVVPACYNLLQPVTPKDSPTKLHQFLLPIEQVLANEYQQLEQIPRLLSFDQTALGKSINLEDTQWPFNDGSVSDTVHEGYKRGLNSFRKAHSEDYGQTLASLQYLTGYFNETVGQNVFSKLREDYIKSQREQLAHLPYDQYHRAGYDNITQRIAGKIGIDSGLIRVVETRRAMPLSPSVTSFDLASVTAREVDGDKERLKLSLNNSNNQYRAGMLVTLKFLTAPNKRLGEGENYFPIECLLVDQVTPEAIFIKIASTPLVNHLEDIVAEGTEVNIIASDRFIADIAFNIMAVVDDTFRENGQKFTLKPFPVLAKEGNILVVAQDTVTADTRDVAGEKYTIESIDRYNHTVTLKNSAGDLITDGTVIKDSYFWYLDSDDPIDRFSFMLSIVLNKQALAKPEQWLEVEQWIKDILRSDLPHHCQALLQWMDQDDFDSFSQQLDPWVDDGCKMGVDSYTVLNFLTLGRKPSNLHGIGYSFIVNEEQLNDLATIDDATRQNYIYERAIFQVNPEEAVP
ncbi:hypothetical protein Sps_01471 [Shewanella psychrophila]|uniref:Uncharacterized protein n=1 Tax=Shewanella psychrophila TaxID=225848 RepID=A0A1S6HM89_9GAMM|nr:hypothetical protein [Shewanella psychrophila]AQS36637.1 hypothetical protein Sps_01471 [Shewanella psychrophila]